MLFPWRCVFRVAAVPVLLLLLASLVLSVHGASKVQKKCPAQDDIRPCRCLLKGQEFQIWCSHSDLPHVLAGLRAISQRISSDSIDELILENNVLPSLPGRVFVPLKVMRLMLRHNGLERVSSDWLGGLEQTLMELFIVEPELRTLSDESLIHLTGLEAITIQTNLMKRLPIISGLPKLKFIQIESMSLLELSVRNFKNLPVLEKLHIANSPKLSRLEANFVHDLPKLQLVNISYCGISWIHPRAIARLPVLKELVLIGNKITDASMIGRGIRDLPQLEIVRLDHNYISIISEASFVDLASLQKLYLSKNRITEIQHGAFHHVPQFRSLDLNSNMLRHIHPESFLQHSGSGLEELFLIDNYISHVDELRLLLDALPRLIFLDMSYNHLEAIPYGALRGHPTLEQLHLDYNKIHIIDNEAFMAMPALRELRLRNNSLSSDTNRLEGPLWNLPALKGLDLSGNFFRHLDPRLLANLPSLRRVDLSANLLTLIDPVSFQSNTLLEHVNLSYNSIDSLHSATFRDLLKLYELDLRFNRLVDFVNGLPRAIEYVYMSHNQINSMPNVDLDLPSLRMLDMSMNRIQRIPPGCMASLSKLKRLYLNQNLIQQLDEKSLSGLSRLELLNLNDNRIMLIHSNSFNELQKLKELNLRNNRLDLLIPELFKQTQRIKRMDVSSNKLADILPGTFDLMQEMQVLDLSDNVLVKLPTSLIALKKLRILDLSRNRLKTALKKGLVLNNLTSLIELSLANNFIQQLERDMFSNLRYLKVLHLQSNEIDVIESNAIRSLSLLKSIKLNQNKLKALPDFSFNDLASLQVIELQENQISAIGKKAFNLVPNLLLLNLSHNQLDNVDEIGPTTKSNLEMLDLSHNVLATLVNSSYFAQLESLVELKLNDNRICNIQDGPFDRMTRLKVLSMRNNKLTTLPQKGLEKLLDNIALLDVDGNPLACTCSLVWMSSWLQKISASAGPKCVDGTFIREMRLSREDCLTPKVDPVAPGCEEYTTTTASPFNTTLITTGLSSNMSKENNAKLGNNLAPLPEESDYFYQDYVDYHPHNNDTDKNAQNNTALSPHHYVTGNTPTIYAATSKNNNKTHPDIPKEVNDSPSTSGFTFFGVPLRDLGSLWGGGGKSGGGSRMDDNNKKSIITQIAQRKTAIVNTNKPSSLPPRGGGNTVRSMGGRLPNSPDIQTGGFIPILPNSGGFKPIIPINNPSIENCDNKSSSVAESALSSSTTITPTTLSINNIVTTENNNQKLSVAVESQSSTTQIPVNVPTTTTVRQEEIEIQIVPSQKNNNNSVEATVTQLKPIVIESSVVATPLSVLLVPGGQVVPSDSPRPPSSPGRSTITKVPSPHVSDSAPLQSHPLDSNDDNGLIIYPEIPPHNRAGKNTKIEKRLQEQRGPYDDTSWYFANYNKTNLEPFVGKSSFSGGCCNGFVANVRYWVIIQLLIVILLTK